MRPFRLLIMLASAVAMYACGTDDIITIDPSSDADDTTSVIDCDYTIGIAFSSTGTASVSGYSDDFDVTVAGNSVTIVNNGLDEVRYELSGTTSDGKLKIYSARPQVVVLNSVSITNTDGAAINIQGPAATPSKAKKTFVEICGNNILADGGSYPATPSDEDEKGTLFSEGDLIFSGSGTLEVHASGKSGIISDDDIRFTTGPSIAVTSSAGHGIKGQESVAIEGGTLSITVSADRKKGINSEGNITITGGATTIAVTGNTTVESGDTATTAGIKADSNFTITAGALTITNSGRGGRGIAVDGNCTFAGGTVDVRVTGANFGSSGSGWGNNTDRSKGAKAIKCKGNMLISGGDIYATASQHEAIETKGTLQVTGGEVYAYSVSDDALNSASHMYIDGGYVYAHSAGNDGIDANGNCYIRGGVVYAIGKSSPEVAIDANTEGGYKLYVEGGTLIAIGGLERGSTLTQSCYQSSSWTRNTWYALTVGDKTYAFLTPSSGGSSIVLSGASIPTLKSGITVSGGTSRIHGVMVEDGTVSGGTSVNLSTYNGNSGGGGGHW